MRELEFRANFFAKLLQSAVWSAFLVVVLLVVFGHAHNVAGWTEGEAFVLGGTLLTMNAVAQALFFSLSEIPQQVRLGLLDYVIVKPVDPQFWVSTRRFSFDQLGTFAVGVIMIFSGLRGPHSAISIAQCLAYGLLWICALGLFYAFNFSLMTTGIWFVKVDNLWVLGESVTQVARFPVDIYSGALRRTLTFILPLAFLATVPTREIVQGLNVRMVIVGLVWTAAALFVSRRFWRFALRSYSSASS